MMTDIVEHTNQAGGHMGAVQEAKMLSSKSILKACAKCRQNSALWCTCHVDENERLQAIVATCERDIGLALDDYNDSQAQLTQMREALEAHNTILLSLQVDSKWNFAARVNDTLALLSSTASSAEWLAQHDAEVEEKVLRNLADIYQGEDDALTTGELRARADALAGEQPTTPPEA